jgi:hypothetical protein
MDKTQQVVGGVTMTLLLVGASLFARESVAKGWAKVAGGKPPPEKSNDRVELKEAAAWALVSGSAVGLARLFVRRAIGYRGLPKLNKQKQQ